MITHDDTMAHKRVKERGHVHLCKATETSTIGAVPPMRHVNSSERCLAILCLGGLADDVTAPTPTRVTIYCFARAQVCGLSNSHDDTLSGVKWRGCARLIGYQHS